MRKARPSRTALKVALAVVTLGAKPGMEEVLPPGIVQASAQLLLASGVVRATTIRWAGSRRAVSVYEAFDWMLPGQFEALAHRKAFFERQVRDAINAEARQVLVLGAGYDTLGWRLSGEFPEVNFLEIDHPATARCKAKGVKGLGPADNLFLIAADLGTHRLLEVLRNNTAWKMGAKTAILAEGLVMYLLPDAVTSLFGQSAELVGADSRFVFSCLKRGADGRPDVGRWTGLMLWMQKLIGEPWYWSSCPEELVSLLKETGWQYLPEPQGAAQIPGIEFFAVATK